MLNTARFSKFPFVVVFLALSFTGCWKGFDHSRTTLAEKAISEDPDLKRIDEICRSISVPSGSTFVGKALLSNYGGLIYFYSYDLELAKIPDHFENYFVNEGWEKTDSDRSRNHLEYKKNDIRTSVEIGAIDKGIDYALYCGPLSDRTGTN